jgi:cell division protein FtsB
MNKEEIAASLREEVGHLEQDVQKLHARVESLKEFVLDLENEINGPQVRKTVPDGKFRKAIDRVFGEKPRRPKR